MNCLGVTVGNEFLSIYGHQQCPRVISCLRTQFTIMLYTKCTYIFITLFF